MVDDPSKPGAWDGDVFLGIAVLQGDQAMVDGWSNPTAALMVGPTMGHWKGILSSISKAAWYLVSSV